LDTKACILAARGRLDEAEILELAALRVAVDSGLPSASLIAGNASATLEETEQLETALTINAEGEAIARRLGDRSGAVFNTVARLPGLLDLGRWDEAVALYAQYLEVDSQHIQGYLVGAAVAVGIGQLSIWRGDVGAARRLVKEIEPVLATADTERRADFDGARAALFNADGNHVEALTVAEGALRACLEPSFPTAARRVLVHAVDAAFALRRNDKVEELIALTRLRHRAGRQPGIDAQILRWQARLAASRGDDAEVAAGFTGAIEGFAALRRPFWVAVVRLELGEWLMRAGLVEEARLPVSLARTTFVELRATPWIERADAEAANREPAQPASATPA
jgi:hypothetical protein